MALLAAWTTPPEDLTPLGQTSLRTLMAWVTLPAYAIGWALEWKVSAIDSGAWGFLWINGVLSVQARNASTSARASATSHYAGPTPHHLAATYDGAAVRLYVDAALISTATLAGPLRSDADVLLIGDGIAPTVTNVRIYDEVLDADRIALAMATPVAVAPDPEAEPDPEPEPDPDPAPTAASFVGWSHVEPLMWPR
jgi:hypothetical protein